MRASIHDAHDTAGAKSTGNAISLKLEHARDNARESLDVTRRGQNIGGGKEQWRALFDGQRLVPAFERDEHTLADRRIEQLMPRKSDGVTVMCMRNENRPLEIAGA